MTQTFRPLAPSLSFSMYSACILLLAGLLVSIIDASHLLHSEKLSLINDNDGEDVTQQRVQFQSMFGLGDSLTDTGNLLLLARALNSTPVKPVQGFSPYGETFFHRPMGRFCDGRLLIDLFAERLGASNYLEPSFAFFTRSTRGTEGSSRDLVNFATAGATVLSAQYLNSTFYIAPYTEYSLGLQLEGLTNVTSFQDKARALVFVGEIGGNDYNYAFGNHHPIEEIRNLIPIVINQLQGGLQMLVENGFKYVVVQSALPMGCIPLYRGVFTNVTKDANGCFEFINSVVHRHNVLLSEMLDNLTNYYNGSAQFVLWDSEKTYMEVFTNPARYGFAVRDTPCYDLSDYFLDLPMNLTDVPACADPSTYMIWDGPHPTEAMNRVMLDLFYTEGYTKPYPNFLTSGSRVIA